jgi:hypothetical protein
MTKNLNIMDSLYSTPSKVSRNILFAKFDQVKLELWISKVLRTGCPKTENYVHVKEFYWN